MFKPLLILDSVDKTAKIFTCSYWIEDLKYHMVACKRRSTINSGAWLPRFDDVIGVEKSCVAKSKKGKK